MNIVFTTTLTGSCLFILTLGIRLLFKDRLSIYWYCHLLRLSVLLFFIPLGIIRVCLAELLMQLSLIEKPSVFRTVSGSAPVLTITPSGVYPNTSYKITLVFFVLWIGIALVLFSCCFLRYLNFRKNLQMILSEITDPELLTYTEDCCTSLHIHRKIRLYRISANITPFAVGVLHPIIVLPEKLSLTHQKLGVHHELYHIKHHDLLFIFLRQAALCFNWFNPLVYCLNNALRNAAEFTCDEAVTQNMTLQEKKDYSAMIIESACVESSSDRIFSVSFSSSYKNIKQRVDFIMKAKRKKGVYSGILAAAAILCSSLPVFAYEVPQTIQWGEELGDDPSWELNNPEDFLAFKDSVETAPSFLPPVLYDYQFVGQNGQIYEIDPDNPASYFSCDHIFEDGEITKHEKKSGGCTVKVCSSNMCIQCDYISSKTFIYDVNFAVCPHE